MVFLSYTKFLRNFTLQKVGNTASSPRRHLLARNDVSCRDDGRRRCRDNTATADRPTAETYPNFILTLYTTRSKRGNIQSKKN